MKAPLGIPPQGDLIGSLDFRHDTLWCGKRFRTFNVFDEAVREVLAIEVDTSWPAARVFRVLEQLKDTQPLPRQLRVYNGPELISAQFVAWCKAKQVVLHQIQPGAPTQNAYFERFNRTFRAEVVDARLFHSLSEVRDHVHHWILTDAEGRSHDALDHLPSTVVRQHETYPQNQHLLARNSSYNLSR